MKYTKKEILTAGKLGEISMIDVEHLISLLDEAREMLNRCCFNCTYRIVGNHIEVYEIDLSEEKVKSFLGSFKINDL